MINIFCCQTGTDASRLEALGAQKDKITVTGNLKFDILLPEAKLDIQAERVTLGLAGSDTLLVCGSTHPKEEAQLLKAYRALLKNIPDIKLLLAPRHPQRLAEIEKLALRFGFFPLPVSQLPAQERMRPKTKPPVFILDTIGQLMHYYCLADIVFVGGSLVAKGGHNILEPAALAKPIIFGPHMFNFRDIRNLFVKERAAVEVDSLGALVHVLGRIARNREERAELGKRALGLISFNQGATLKTLQVIKDRIKL